MTLQELKDDYAYANGHENWDSLVLDHIHDGGWACDALITHIDNVIKLTQRELLKKINRTDLDENNILNNGNF